MAAGVTLRTGSLLSLCRLFVSFSFTVTFAVLVFELLFCLPSAMEAFRSIPELELELEVDLDDLLRMMFMFMFMLMLFMLLIVVF